MPWEAPKTDWKGTDLGFTPEEADVPGAGDFNRIEKNILYLNKCWAIPSDNVLMTADTERSSPAGGGVVKSFMITVPGRYRIRLDGRVTGGPGPGGYALITVRGVGFSRSPTGWGENYITWNFDTPVILAPSVIEIELGRIIGTYSYWAAVKNVRICGTITEARPDAGVLLD